MGPHNSVPFSKAHIQVCTDVAIVKRKPNQDEESEPPWSDPEEDQNHHDTMLVPSMSTHAGPIATSGAMVLGTTVAAPGGTTISISDGIRRARRQQMAPHAPTPRRVGQPPAPPQKATPRRARLSDDEGSDVSDTPREGHDSALADKQADGPKQRSALLLLQEKTMLRHMIQEEVIPAHGSIYPRTLTPGPGYYGVPDVAPPAAASFGRRRKGCIDAAVDAHRMVPDPGTYEPKPAMSSGKKSLGMFDKAYVSTLMTPADTTRKLPFISNGSSLREAPGVHSPPTFHPIMPEATSRTQHHPSGSSWGFGSLRRPF